MAAAETDCRHFPRRNKLGMGDRLHAPKQQEGSNRYGVPQH